MKKRPKWFLTGTGIIFLIFGAALINGIPFTNEDYNCVARLTTTPEGHGLEIKETCMRSSGNRFRVLTSEFGFTIENGGFKQFDSSVNYTNTD